MGAKSQLRSRKPGGKNASGKKTESETSSATVGGILVGSIVVGLLAAYGLGLLSPSTHDSTLPPATAARIKNWKHFPELTRYAQAKLANATEAQEGLIRPLPSDRLQRWNPVRVGFERKLVLDDTGKVFTMRTMGMDPPIFEIDNFLTKKECRYIMKLANRTGFMKSDHTYLDGSNYDDKDKDTSTIDTEDEANKLFRYSDQTWLQPHVDKYLQDALDRVMNLGLLPEQVRTDSEALQVAKYRDWGHYESHHDSEKEDMGPCCIDPWAKKQGMETGVYAVNKPLTKRCKLCRFMTVLYYLVDTEEGGGTIFPLADMSDAYVKAWQTNVTNPLMYKQTRDCENEKGTKVYPKAGKAVMWYNHKVDRGYLGPLDVRSLHGGCNVKKGEKWIANHWMSAIQHPDYPRDYATAGF